MLCIYYDVIGEFDVSTSSESESCKFIFSIDVRHEKRYQRGKAYEITGHC